MKDLESKLRAIPLRSPSPNLDGRVQAQKPQEAARAIRIVRRPVPAWVAAMAAAALAVLGFALGYAWRNEPTPNRLAIPSPGVQSIQIIQQAPSYDNPFDFTYASDFFPVENLEAKIITGKGA